MSDYGDKLFKVTNANDAQKHGLRAQITSWNMANVQCARV